MALFATKKQPDDGRPIGFQCKVERRVAFEVQEVEAGASTKQGSCRVGVVVLGGPVQGGVPGSRWSVDVLWCRFDEHVKKAGFGFAPDSSVERKTAMDVSLSEPTLSEWVVQEEGSQFDALARHGEMQQCLVLGCQEIRFASVVEHRSNHLLVCIEYRQVKGCVPA